MNKRNAAAAKTREPAECCEPARSILDGYLTKDQLAAELHVTPRTLDIWNSRGLGPPRTNVGRVPYYALRAARVWLEGRQQLVKNVP